MMGEGQTTSMEEHPLLIELTKRLAERKHFLLAFSGGLDSCVLLHLLCRLRERYRPDIQLRAIHIHHGLSSNADQWSEHCHAIAAQWGVPIETFRVSLSVAEDGIEAAAREARYQVFAEQMQQGETVLTAQHLDDQCETFLLALKRGSGPAGLASMAESMVWGKGELLRPLLATSRQQLEQYARQHALQWVEDESNQEVRFDRNFLRLQITPLLYRRWPHFAQAVARSAALCAEQEALLDELLQEQLQQLLDPQGSISIDGLVLCTENRRSALLRRWFAHHSALMPSRIQLLRLWHEVALSRQDAEPCLQLGKWQIRRFRGRLYLLPHFISLRSLALPWIAPYQPLLLPDGLGRLTLTTGREGNIRAPTATEKVEIRFAAQGNISIVGREHSRSIKKLWQEFALPPWQRERIPLLYFNDQLIAALGVFITREGAAQQQAEGWQIIWQQQE